MQDVRISGGSTPWGKGIGGSHPPEYYQKLIDKIINDETISSLNKLEQLVELYHQIPSQDLSETVKAQFSKAFTSLSGSIENFFQIEYHDALCGRVSGPEICKQLLEKLQNFPPELEQLRKDWTPILTDTRKSLLGEKVGPGFLDGLLRHIEWCQSHIHHVDPLMWLQHIKDKEASFHLPKEMQDQLDKILDPSITQLSKEKHDRTRDFINEIMTSKTRLPSGKIYDLRHILSELKYYRLKPDDEADIEKMLKEKIEVAKREQWEERLQRIQEALDSGYPKESKIAWLERMRHGGDLDIAPTSPGWELTEAQRAELYQRVEQAIADLKK